MNSIFGEVESQPSASPREKQPATPQPPTACDPPLARSLPTKETDRRRRLLPRAGQLKGCIPRREKAALERLMRIAQADTGQGRMTASFLLSWWNAPNFGGFDLTTLWNVDPEIAADMVKVFSWVSKRRHFPDDLGYDEQFKRIVHAWSPPAPSAPSDPGSDVRPLSRLKDFKKR